MTSCKEVRNQLLISSGEGVLNDHELLLLCDLKRSDILNLSSHSFPEFNFDDLETAKITDGIYPKLYILNTPIQTEGNFPGFHIHTVCNLPSLFILLS